MEYALFQSVAVSSVGGIGMKPSVRVEHSLNICIARDVNL